MMGLTQSIQWSQLERRSVGKPKYILRLKSELLKNCSNVLLLNYVSQYILLSEKLNQHEQPQHQTYFSDQ